MKENTIAVKTYQFAIRIVKVYVYLKEEKKEFHLSAQILKSGTSIGANVEEAIGGSSRKDFRAKLDIAYKEARETEYWLRLLKDTDFIDTRMYNSLHADCEELLKILTAIINKLKAAPSITNS